MGLFNSKVDVAAIEAIEFNVSDLIIRLGEEEVKIDDYVMHRIYKALAAYFNFIEKEKKKGYISKRKMQKMNDLICQATSKLKRLPTIQRKYEATEKKTPYQMKTELCEIEKLLNNNRIKDHEFQHYLDLVTMYSHNLEHNSKTSMPQEQEDDISMLLLKLFLRSPLVKTSDVLQHTFYNLHRAVENFEVFSANSVTVFNAEEVKKHLEEIKAKMETINQGVSKLDEEVKSKGVNAMKQDSITASTYASMVTNTSLLSSNEEQMDETQISRYENILEQIENDLYEYNKVVDKFCSPISDAAINNVKQKLHNLLNNHLQKVPDQGGLRYRKKSLFDKGAHIADKLIRINEENKEINENLKVLADVQNNLSTFVGSNLSFKEKRSNLESLVEFVKQINTNNSEVIMQKTEVVNRIEGSLIVDCMIYLRQLKKTVDNQRMYAQQFAYPRSVDLYRSKTEEIRSLKKYLDDIPKGNESVDTRVKDLLEQIDEILEVFECKVKYNEGVIASLECLENIVIEIDYTEQHLHSRVAKLERFNDVRRRIDSVSAISHRVSNKKMEILRKLHVLEGAIYPMKYPIEIQEMKTLLNEHEKHAQQLIQPISSAEYEHERKEILTLLDKTKVLMREKHIGFDCRNVINKNFELVLKLLENTGKEVQRSSDRIQSLEIMKNEVLSVSTKHLSFSKKLEQLEQQEGLIKMMRKTTTDCKVDVSAVFENTEKLIAVEKSKIQLTQMHIYLSKFAEDITHPMDTDFFKHKLNEMLHMKELVEDAPEGNPELDTMKQSFAKELLNNLRKLDEFVANLVNNRKQSENILDLQSHFNDFNLDAINIKRESVEFVDLVRQRANFFEDCVKYYLGTNYSVDYYVIHENLMRLVEELDRLSCEDPILLNAIVGTIGYIKNLIDQLDSNACGE